MATWTDFEVAAPEIAGKGRDLLYRTGAGEGLFVTIRGDGLPRAHPVNVGVVDGHLYTFAQAKSAKRRDLEEDGRYALHAYVIPEAPHEFLVRGHARLVEDQALRRMIAADWFFTVSDAYPLYELLISSALLGERPTADDWPPVYSSWSAG
jgi:hypothetical protein